MNNYLKSIANEIERKLKNIYYSIPDYYRCGKVFRENYCFLKQSQIMSLNDIKSYQLNEIKNILQHSYNSVPYYKMLLDKNNIKIDDINKLDDIKLIPFLDKEIIKENMKQLISNKYKKKQIKYVTTGGSTGTPMGFYIDKRYDFEREWAFIANMWSRVGYDIKKKNKMVVLRGNIVKSGFYEYNNNKLILSSFDIEKNIIEYIKLIENYNPQFIQAYPSAILIIANYILDNNIKVNFKDLKAIICSSENIYGNQRKTIEKAFSVRVYSFYGHSEHACIAGECEVSDYYHVDPFYGYTEILDENGEDICEEGKIGELVVTGFNNYVFPFIRYKTGDLAMYTNKKCSCGRNFLLIKRIEGRKQEYFINNKGEKVIFTWADYPMWQCREKIWAYQYFQEDKGKVILNIHFKDGESYDFDKIKNTFNRYYKEIELEVNSVEYIERTKRGKFKYLIQNINM